MLLDLDEQRMREYFDGREKNPSVVLVTLDYSGNPCYRAAIGSMLYDFEVKFFNLGDDEQHLVVGIAFDNLADWKHFCVECRQTYKMEILQYGI